MKATTEAPPGRWRRLAWFGGLWVSGVVVLAVLAYGLRLLFGLA